MIRFFQGFEGLNNDCYYPVAVSRASAADIARGPPDPPVSLCTATEARQRNCSVTKKCPSLANEQANCNRVRVCKPPIAARPEGRRSLYPRKDRAWRRLYPGQYRASCPMFEARRARRDWVESRTGIVLGRTRGPCGSGLRRWFDMTGGRRRARQQSGRTRLDSTEAWQQRRHPRATPRASMTAAVRRVHHRVLCAAAARMPRSRVGHDRPPAC